jgi:hypothetical protein
MFRRLSLIALLFLLASSASAACNLTITEASCAPGVHGTVCEWTTRASGSDCKGFVYTFAFSTLHPDDVTITAPDTDHHFDFCFGSEEFREFGAEVAFAFCLAEDDMLASGEEFTSSVLVDGLTEADPLLVGTYVGDEEGNEIGSAYVSLNAASASCTPTISAPPIVQSGVAYTVSWSPVSDPGAQYILQESTSPDFSSNVTETQLAGLSRTFNHDNMATETRYYYRVRATRCNGQPTPFSGVAVTVVQSDEPIPAANAEIVAAVGTTQEIFTDIFLPPHFGKSAATVTFTAAMDKPFLGVNPKSGVYPPEGLKLTITSRPKDLPAGASTGTLSLNITETPSANGVAGQATTSSVNIPVSINLVTPVAPGGKTMPPPNALIIPIVTHVNVTDGQFLSDVRLTNGGDAPVSYRVTLSPTQTDARDSSKVTQVTVGGQQTIALNDIVKNFFGFGATSNPADIGFGALEIRPMSSSTRTYASSRTYAKVLAGTFGQFIAAVPVTKFATKALTTAPIPGGPPAALSTKLSLQQIAQSSKFRTNLGIVEGAGQPASGRIRIFDRLGTLLKTVPFELRPGEHRQMNQFIADPRYGGIATLDDGRIEIEIDSDTGAVTAYASVLDNITTDPLAVMPVDPMTVLSRRHVIPGMAELPNRVDNFHSDLRVFNGGPSAVNATFTFYPQGGGAASAPQQRTIGAGEVFSVDNVLPAMFGASGTGGSIVITTQTESALVVTGRTYTLMDNGGTFGQFIPGVTPEEAIGLGERGLEILQLEHSDRFRTNVGVAEVSGQPAEVRVSVSVPDSKTSVSINKALAPNEFYQFNGLIRALLGSNAQVYNVRATVEVVSGNGRVTAYGSVIDNASKDPTYIPAQ